jgi:hypothetical protein
MRLQRERDSKEIVLVKHQRVARETQDGLETDVTYRVNSHFRR